MSQNISVQALGNAGFDLEKGLFTDHALEKVPDKLGGATGEVETGTCVDTFAFMRCEDATDCPRGFFCAMDIYQNGTEVNICKGDCPAYEAAGVFD